MVYTPADPFPKARGHAIRSQDWNAAINEIVRLEKDKVNRAGDGIAGALTVTGNVGIGTTNPQHGRLMIEHAAVPLALRETGQAPTAGGLWRLALDGGALRLDANTAAAADFSSFSSALSMNASGNVGVGTSPQAARLSVAGATGGIAVESGTANNVALTLRSGGVGWGSGLLLSNTTATTGRNYGIYAGSDGSLHVADTTTGADRLIVNNAGNVGIGVASPQRTLSVNAALNVDQANANGGTLNPGISFGSNSGEGVASKRTAGGNQAGLDLYTNNAARLSITNGGNVGIGTLTPRTRLEVRGSLTLEEGTSPVLFTGTGTSELNRYLLLANSPDSTSASGLKVGGVLVSDDYQYASPPKNNLIVKGSVGIGTTNPQYGRLMIEDAAAPLSLRETGQAATSGGLWRLALDDGTIRFDANAAAAGDFTSYNTPLNMSPAGNVGIGTPPENSESWNRVLDVLGGAHAKLSVRTSSIDARLMAHGSGVYGAPAGAVVGTSTAHPLSFVTGATSRMLIDTSGRVGIGLPQGAAIPYKLDVRAEGAGTQQAGRFMSQTDTANAEARGLEVTTSGAGTGWKRPLTLTASGPGHKTGQWITLTNSGDNNYQSMGTFSSVDHHPNLQNPNVGQFSAYGIQSQVYVRRDPSNSNANIPTGGAFGLYSYVYGDGPGTKYGVYANATSSDPTAGANTGTKYGIYAAASGSGNVWAGYFSGNVQVAGTLSTTGAKPFVIDHPLDPENKTLRHNAVESPEVLCLYRGKVKLGSSGRKMVRMPEYFAALTKEEEATVYLTPIGKEPSPASYEWDETNTKLTVHAAAGSEVAYLVLAARDDPAVHMFHRPVEEEKGENNFEKGTLLSPVALGESAERGFAAIPTPEGDVEGAPFVAAPPAPVAPGEPNEPSPEGSDGAGGGSGKRQTGRRSGRSKSSQGRRRGSRE